MKLKYYKNLDGVRAIAALMVIIFHFFSFNIINTYNYSWLVNFTKIAKFGQTGVSLFFVLSGFVITRILISSRESENYFKSFYIRRSLRIFPLYYLYLVIYFYVTPFLSGGSIVAFSNQLGSYFYLQNIATTFKWIGFSSPNHFWSLAVEEHFYLFWPLLIYFFSLKRLPYIIGIVFFVSLITKHILLINNYDIGYFTFTRIDQLSLGALLAYLEFNNNLNKNNSKLFVLLIIFSIALVGLTITIQNSNHYIKEMIKYPILGLLYFSCIGWLVINSGKNQINNFLQLNFLKFSGKISYGLYVYHPLAILVLKYFFQTGNIFIDFILVFLITYLLAFLSYKYFESKFLVFKERFNY